MKRSVIVNLIQEILNDYYPEYSDSSKEVASLLLSVTEDEGMRLCQNDEPVPWEPEEGWDAYFTEQDRKERLRDFQVTVKYRGGAIAQAFLDGTDFEQLAEENEVTVERIRQIVSKARRLYHKKTNCIDCGTETKPGAGSARCKECWDHRTGRE